MEFTSDNCWGASPEILKALADANQGATRAYGADKITSDLERQFRELFGIDLGVYPVITGTAANAIGIAALTEQSGQIYCYEKAHIYGQEAGAIEFMANSSRLVQVEGNAGKMCPAKLETALAACSRGLHYMRPTVLSLSQATEMGTVYTVEEITTLCEIGKRYGLMVHMDGARFANAVARLGCTPADLTWKAGVDILSFGATKNGTLCADAIIVFRSGLAQRLETHWKRSGHLASKMRFLSAQLAAYLQDDLWLRNAREANEAAQILATEISRSLKLHICHPVETNAVFIDIPHAMFENLTARGSASFHQQSKDYSRLRYMTSFMTPEEDIKRFAGELTSLAERTATVAE